MKVAGHAVPGKLADTIRPVGNGMRWVVSFVPRDGLGDVTAARSYRTLRDGIIFGTTPGTSCQASAPWKRTSPQVKDLHC